MIFPLEIKGFEIDIVLVHAIPLKGYKACLTLQNTTNYNNTTKHYKYNTTNITQQILYKAPMYDKGIHKGVFVCLTFQAGQSRVGGEALE